MLSGRVVGCIFYIVSWTYIVTIMRRIQSFVNISGQLVDDRR